MMDEQLLELQALAEQARSKKGRMDAPSRLRAAKLLVSLWRESPEAAREIPLLLDDLSSEAVADAVSKMWPSLPPERRLDFKKALYTPTTERAIRRFALLVASVINFDGGTAFEWLQILLPPERQKVGKDVQQTLSTVLFASPPLAFENLARAHSDSREVCRIYSTLWEIAKSAPYGSSLMARARLARAFVRFSSAEHQENIHTRTFLIDLQDEKSRWPAQLQELFVTDNPELRPMVTRAVNEEKDAETSSNRPVFLVASDAQPPERAAPNATDASEEQVETEIHSVANEVAVRASAPEMNSLDLLDRLADSAKSDLSTLSRVQGIVRTLISESNSLRGELDRTKQSLYATERGNREKVLELEQQCAAFEVVVAELKSEAQASQERVRSAITELTKERNEAIYEVSRIRAEIAQTKSTWDAERALLAHQISVNAAGRVEEFRKRLGGALSRLARDLPQKDEVMSPELGSAVLLLFHQFVGALQEQGIPLTTERNLQ
jgi:hypothetical protein